MPTYKQDVAFGMQTDYALEEKKLERQRKLAEALQAQSMAPSGGTDMVGGWAIPKSPMEGLGKAAQGMSAAYQIREADDREKQLAQTMRTQGQNDVQDFTSALNGRAAQAPTVANDDEGNAMPGVAAQAPDRQKALAIALQSQNPMVASAGGSMLAEMLKTPEGAFAKIDPSKYTPESIRLFAAGNGKDFGVLKPRDKIVGDTLGGTTNYRTEYDITPLGSAQHTPAPRIDTVNQGNKITPVLLDQNGAKPVGNSMPVEVSPNTAATNAVTMRGQNMTDARQQDQNAIANNSKNVQVTEGVRKEFENLPEVKNYKQVVPIYESVKKAPNTPAGDIDLIYGVGKIMDPGSVVREGELNLVIKAGSPMERFQGYLSYIKGGGRLPPQQRQELMKILDNRVGEAKTQYENARGSYSTILKKQGIDPDQVFTTVTGKAAPKVGDIVDGHEFLGGEPANPSSWKKVR